MFHFSDNSNDQYDLQTYENRLQLIKRDEPKLGAIYVDFVSNVSEHRRKYGGGRKQAIAKAVGLKKGATPTIVDATAGLGRDAFVLASLGCRVHMIERSPVVAVLLEDGLKRAKLDSDIGMWVAQLMSFDIGDSRQILQSLPFEPDVVYLDPMYPDKKKPALVKKEMRIFKDLVGHDSDSSELLNIALNVARKRVVVKRPAYADCLAGQKPDVSHVTKKNRFDIYLSKMNMGPVAS